MDLPEATQAQLNISALANIPDADLAAFGGGSGSKLDSSTAGGGGQVQHCGFAAEGLEELHSRLEGLVHQMEVRGHVFISASASD
jgi:hypothetical protein